MTSQDYATTFLADQSPDEVFEAVTNARGWWSGDIEGSTGNLGDEFTYSYQDVHYSRQKITELIPVKRSPGTCWTPASSSPRTRASGRAPTSRSRSRKRASKPKSASPTGA